MLIYEGRLNWSKNPLDSAELFYRECLPGIRRKLQNEANPDIRDGAIIVFRNRWPSHRAWRLAVIQDLARESAPKRVNGIVAPDHANIHPTVEWLTQAPGVTGQLLEIERD
jgi:hypothetical protein